MPLRISSVQVAMNFTARNQHTSKAGELSEYFSANEAAYRFFANAQFSGTAFHIEGLAFRGCCRFHKNLRTIIPSLYFAQA